MYLKASKYTSEGSKLAELEKHREANKLYTQAIAIDPQFQLAYTGRAVSYYILKEDRLALKDLNKVIEINPKYDNAYLYRGVIYTKL